MSGILWLDGALFLLIILDAQVSVHGVRCLLNTHMHELIFSPASFLRRQKEMSKVKQAALNETS